MKVKRICDNLIKLHYKYLKVSEKNEFLTKLPRHGRFRAIMEDVDSLTPEELGIRDPNDPYYFIPNYDKDYDTAAKIRATDILDTEDYAILIFFLKKGASLPLHDHEDMIIYSKVLTGRIRYRAMDKIDIKYNNKDHSSVLSCY